MHAPRTAYDDKLDSGGYRVGGFWKRGQDFLCCSKRRVSLWAQVLWASSDGSRKQIADEWKEDGTASTTLWVERTRQLKTCGRASVGANPNPSGDAGDGLRAAGGDGGCKETKGSKNRRRSGRDGSAKSDAWSVRGGSVRGASQADALTRGGAGPAWPQGLALAPD